MITSTRMGTALAVVTGFHSALRRRCDEYATLFAITLTGILNASSTKRWLMRWKKVLTTCRQDSYIYGTVETDAKKRERQRERLLFARYRGQQMRFIIQERGQ